MTVLLKRAQKGKAAGIDTTMMSAQGLARAFAPTKAMVFGHKNQTCLDQGRPLRYPHVPPMSTEEYERRYQQILEQVPKETWRWLYAQAVNGELTLICYCRDDWFCHTYLIIAYACAKYPRAFRSA